MDSKKFEELVSRLAKTPSRRDALKGAVGGLLGVVGVTSAGDVVEAGRNGRRRRRGGGGSRSESESESNATNNNTNTGTNTSTNNNTNTTTSSYGG